MKSTTELGKEKESLTESFLQQKGYVILDKNYRYKKGEIDLIAKQEEILVFVEVKYRKNNRFGFPETAVSESKENLIRATAENYIFEKNWKGRIRFDIVAISGKEVMHLEDAF
jgi:putative endonuclease